MTGAGWLWPMLPLKALSFGRSQFMRPIGLLGLFFNDPKQIILVGDLNVILDFKIDKVGWGASVG